MVAISIQDLSLRQLQYVVAVADTLGFRRAAERCAVSQPTLSTQVQHLEAELGALEHAEVMRDPFVVAMPKGHRLAKKKKIAQRDLDDQDVLLLEDGHCLRSQALALCSKAGAHEMDLRATSLATLVQMVAGSSAVTLLPDLALSVENRGGQLEISPFSAPIPFRTLALVWRPRSPFADAFRRTASTLRAARA